MKTNTPEQQQNISIAVVGDTIINRRVSVVNDERFLSLIKVIREADVGYAQLETLVTEYDGPEIYPSAESPLGWLRSPRFVPDEMKWAGFDIVSLASNHTLDYSYGGLYSTLNALNEAGIPHAGVGMNLGEAREPAYLDTPKGRVALISMCTSFTEAARAGEVRRDVKGRPGLNPLRYHWAADAETLELAKQFFTKIGWWTMQAGKDWLFYPSGRHMAYFRFAEGDQPGIVPVVNEEDAEGNLKAISEARRQADWVIVAHHNHEFDADARSNSLPVQFTPPFARSCIDAGADMYVAQGSHAMPRGMEVYKNKPIFYDPGDFMFMVNTITRMPADFYFWPPLGRETRDWKATVADAYDAKEAVPKPLNPPGGVSYTQSVLQGKVLGSVVALCNFSEDRKLTEVKLHPLTLIREPRSQFGLPLAADAETARILIEHFAELSSAFGTKVEFKDGIGVVKNSDKKAP